MPTYSTDFLGKGTYYVDVSESSPNSGTNTSVVSFTVRLVGNNASWDGTTRYWSVTYDGVLVGPGGSFTYDFRSNNTPTLGSGFATVTHTADGSKTVAVVSGFTGGSASGNFVLTDFVFVPAAPAAPSLTRASNGSTITMSVSAPSSAVTISNYEYQYSSDGSTYSSVGSTGSSSSTITNWTTPSATTGYYIRGRAYSTEGWGSYGPPSFIAGIPSVPISISASRSGRNVTVTVGPSATNGGATISGYYVQSSTDGTTWTTAAATTGGSYTYTSLTPGLTYMFRAYATNSTGNSATTSTTVFVPAGGKRFDGSIWTSTSTAKRFDGTNWVDLTIAKRYDGTNWVDLS